MAEHSLEPKPRRVRRPSFFAKDRVWLNVLLFVLTIGSTFVVGLTWSASFLQPSVAGAAVDSPAANPGPDVRAIALSLVYTIVLLLILTAHEMGHYLTCRRYGLSVTLPFFIPAPTLIGTMGAFIRIRSPITDKRSLFDMGRPGRWPDSWRRCPFWASDWLSPGSFRPFLGINHPSFSANLC